MDESKLPSKRPTGVQLGLGIKGPYLYTLSHSGKDKNWLGSIDDDLPETFSDFRITSGRVLIDKHWNPVPISENKEETFSRKIPKHIMYNDLERSDTLDENNEDEIEHVEDNGIISELAKADISKPSKVEWGKMGLSLLKSQLPIFENVKAKERNMIYLSPITQFSSFHFDCIPRSILNTDFWGQPDVDNKLLRSNKRYTVVVNPTVTDTIMIGRVQLSLDLSEDELNYRQIFLYSSGKTNSRLNISVIGKTKDGSSTFPILRRIHTVDLHASIKSIKLPVFSSEHARLRNILGVITDTALHIIKIKSIEPRSSRITLIQMDPLSFTELSDFPLADFAFNPWNTNEIAIIDIKGNWAIGKIPMYSSYGTKIELVRELRGSIYDPEVPSMQKSITWSTRHTRLLASDNSRIIELDFADNWQAEIAQAKTWSDILDMRKVTDSITMVLTTQEIIVLTTRHEAGIVRREVSWKHDLDPTDKTYKFSIESVLTSRKNLFFVFVYSKKHNNIYMHTFTSGLGFGDSSIQSSGMSTVISVPGTFKGIQSVAFFNDLLDKSDEVDLSDLTLNLYVRGWRENKVINITLSNSREKIKSGDGTDLLALDEIHNDEETLQNLAPKNLSHIPKAIEKLMDGVVGSLRNKRLATPESRNDDECLGKFGYNLSQGLNEFLSRSKGRDDKRNNSTTNYDLQPLLLVLAKPPEYFDDLNEFFSLLHQFYAHYKDQDISFTNLLSVFQLLIHDEVGNVDELYNKLLQCWGLVCNDADAEFLTKEVIKFIIWSSHHFTSVDKYTELEDKLQETLNPEYKELIDSWDTQEDDVDSLKQSLLGTIPRSSQPQFSLSSQSQIPEIKSSQNLRKVYKKRPTISSSQRLSSSQASLPDTMTPAFSLMGPSSQLSRPSSQIDTRSGFKLSSSQPTKRKKRKVRGFN